MIRVVAAAAASANGAMPTVGQRSNAAHLPPLAARSRPGAAMRLPTAAAGRRSSSIAAAAAVAGGTATTRRRAPLRSSGDVAVATPRGALVRTAYRRDGDDDVDVDVDAPHPSAAQGQDDEDLVPVEFTLGHHCQFGERFALVGDCEALGEWDPSRALKLEWRDGDVWTAVVPLPAGRPVSFKPVLLSDSDGSCVGW